MSHLIKTLTLSTYLQLLNYTRIKQAVFFTIVFPVLIFVLFGNIWGFGESDYLFFLLTGVIAATTASEGLFATGPVIKGYAENNLIKFFRNLPFNVMTHFFGLFLSRIGIMLITLLALTLCYLLLFAATLTVSQWLLCAAGLMLGFILFSLLGLLLSFYGEGAGRGGVAGLLYFLMLFTTDVYYPISEMSTFLGRFTALFPITYLLNFMRGDVTSILPISLWIIVLAVAFYLVFTKSQLKR